MKTYRGEIRRQVEGQTPGGHSFHSALINYIDNNIPERDTVELGFAGITIHLCLHIQQVHNYSN